MPKKAPPGQMALFTDEQMDTIEQKLEKRAVVGGIKVTWSKAQERRLFAMFTAMVVHAICAPITLQRGQGWVTNDVAKRHEMDVFIERMLRVKRWCDELKRETEEAETKEDLQEAYARLLGMKQDVETRLTNMEVCLVLMECSLQAPLSSYVTEEYKRAFAHVFGLETYMRIWSTGTWPELIRVAELEAARYDGKIQRRFPRLDEAERAWIEDFNAQVTTYTKGQRWPGTNGLVVVGTDDPIDAAGPIKRPGQPLRVQTISERRQHGESAGCGQL